MPLEPAEGAFPRRAFLAAAGGFVAAITALPILIDRLGAASTSATAPPIDLGPLAAFREGEYTLATCLADPAAGGVSRRTAYVRSNGLLRGEPSFTILSSRCTHVGCPTQPSGPLFPARRRRERTRSGGVDLVPALPAGFGCPCHGSQFDLEGNRTAGPAVRALDRYAFSIVDGRLVLGALYSVSRVRGTGAAARIPAFPLRDPGQPASGPEALLYPVQPPR